MGRSRRQLAFKVCMNCNTFYSMGAYQTTANALANAKLGMNRQQWIATLATELLLLCLVKVEKQK